MWHHQRMILVYTLPIATELQKLCIVRDVTSVVYDNQSKSPRQIYSIYSATPVRVAFPQKSSKLIYNYFNKTLQKKQYIKGKIIYKSLSYSFARKSKVFIQNLNWLRWLRLHKFPIIHLETPFTHLSKIITVTNEHSRAKRIPVFNWTDLTLFIT